MARCHEGHRCKTIGALATQVPTLVHLRTSHVCKDALCVGGLVLVTGQHPVQAIVPDLLQKPLDVRPCTARPRDPQSVEHGTG